MAFLIDLPRSLEEEFWTQANREGITASEHATYLLQLVATLTHEGWKTPFGRVVRAYLRQNSLDADRLANVLEGLTALCLQNHEDPSIPSEEASEPSIESLNRDQILRLLRGWRSPEVHNSMVHNIDILVHELPPLDRLVQRAGRTNRVSALGRFAHLGLSSEAFMEEKRQDTVREDQPR